ncbi:poly-gamma-glutamate hydrolase family protein [Staphylococcus warneri]|uniref:poly-gamma-glutamate hydrolase family protein n=1 Tax=Staphylococcus warneri TaxID=1292 RepID=UPI003BA0E183
MKRYVTKKTKPIVKITLGLITASISLGTISVVTQQATAHASTVQTTHNHTSTHNQTRTPSIAPHISQTKTPVKHVTTTVKAPTTVKTTTKVATIKQPTQTVKTVSVSAPKTSRTSTIKTSTSHTQKPTSAKAPTSTHHKSSTTMTKTSTNHTTTTKAPITKATVSKTSTSTAKAPSSSTSLPSTKPSTTTASSTKPVTPTTSTTTQTSASSKDTNLPSTGAHSDAKPIIPVESTHKDYYTSMTQLERETKEGIDWKKETRDQGNQVLIVAPHGGNIEQGTSELTKLLAQQGGYDYFSFEATRPSNNTQLHVTSTHYDDPTLHQMIEGRAATISIHGAKGDDQIVFLGGAKSDLRDAIQSQLESRGFAVQVPPEYLGGLNEDNFINKNENSTGVQLELTTALRKALFINQDMSTTSRKNENNWSPLMYQFVDALHIAISQTTETSTH